jgi:glycosyltransferase involved in cell wall biosynthesis
MKSNTARKYLIVDFGASLIHTHHKQAIYSFIQLFDSLGIPSSTWVPTGSDLTNKKNKIFGKLLPGTHPTSFKLLRTSSWIPGILGKIHNLAIKYGNRFVLRLIVKITVMHFYYKLKFKMKRTRLNIVFPTACPFAVSAIYKLEKKKLLVNAFVRVTNTSERRNVLGEMFPINNLINDSKKFGFVKINFGFETNAYLKKSGFFGMPNVHISKFAAGNKGPAYQLNGEKLVISFLGYPTKDKGHDLIFPIMKGVSKVRPELEWQVQVYEHDLIEEDLKNLNLNIQILKGKISQESLELALKNSSLIILPYNPLAFKYNASAMMYQASDFCIPIITLDGSAFASEVEEFRIGKVCKDTSEMVENLQNISSSQIEIWKNNFTEYNNYRNKTNILFLEINQDDLPG